MNKNLKKHFFTFRTFQLHIFSNAIVLILTHSHLFTFNIRFRLVIKH